MKSFFYVLAFFVSQFASAQAGFEGIFVEKYYVSDEQDQTAFKTGGILESGSTTYRIYVDLEPGYRLQAVYGAPGHPLIIKSTGLFYNHPNAGVYNANILPEKSLSKDISLLDSWLSMGSAGENHYGVPRYIGQANFDSTIALSPKFLNNKIKKEKKQLKESNGMVRSYHVAFPTFYEMDSCLKSLGAATLSDSLVINNGAWASLGRGAAGADSLGTNMVLIAQLTTKGDLSFELNIQIGDEFGNPTKFVARNAGYKEFEHPALIYSSGKKKKTRKMKSDKK